MKRMITIATLLVALTTGASAQGLLGGLLGGSSSSSSSTTTASTLTNILSGLAGTVYTAKPSLDGNYTYNGVAVSVSSSEGGVLSNLAGTAVTSGIEAKVDEKLSKFGIKPGNMTITFNNDDNTFTWNVFGINLPGTFKVGDNEQTVTLTFGKKMQFLSMTGNLESTLNGAKLLFPANKTAAFLKKVAAQVGESSAEVATIAKLADGYDNYKIGFKLAK